jgi:hypothetical protein
MSHLCNPCKQQGRLVAGVRPLPSGAWQCDDHWRQHLGIPKQDATSEAKGENEMGKKPEPDAIDAMKKDAATGMNVNAIAEKHGVTWATAQKYSGAEAGKNGVRAGIRNAPQGSCHRSLEGASATC